MTQTFYNHHEADVALHIQFKFAHEDIAVVAALYKKLRDFLRIKRVNWFTVEVSWLGEGEEMTYLDFSQYLRQFRDRQLGAR